MEYTSGIRIRDIFLDNYNWWHFFNANKNLIRKSIKTNVIKMLSCRTALMGYLYFSCPKCKKSIKVPHSCKSRFCSSCGKKATDIWIKNAFNALPRCKYQHITFTMPSHLWPFFWLNRHLLGKIPLLAANIILKAAKKQGVLPGIYLAIHTAKRNIGRNVHIHLSVTIGGLSIIDQKFWIDSLYFDDKAIKKMWRYEVISLFRKEYKNNNLILTKKLKHIKTYTAFNSWLNFLYQKQWVVHLNTVTKNFKNTLEYLGRYLKRPPLGETHILSYEGKHVTFEYLDHYTKNITTTTLPVMEFIAKIISHIPDRYFRLIRYYGFLSNRLRGKLIPVINRLLGKIKSCTKKVYISWRQMILTSFGYDPLSCPHCGTFMELLYNALPAPVPLSSKHEQIARGFYTRI